MICGKPNKTIERCVAKLHTLPGKGVVFATGGGCETLAFLCRDGGASGTLEDFAYPYAARASEAVANGPTPVNTRTARNLATAAFQHALNVKGGDYPSFGVGCTSKLVKTSYDPHYQRMQVDERAGRAHEIYLAVHTAEYTMTGFLPLNLSLDDVKKTGLSIRGAEERVNSLMIIDAITRVKGLDPDFGFEDDFREDIYDRVRGDIVWSKSTLNHPSLRDLMNGVTKSVGVGFNEAGVFAARFPDEIRLVVCGSFNPLHEGHLGMLRIGEKVTGLSGGLELGLINADKPMLDYFDLKERLDGVSRLGSPLIITRAATFAEKAKVLPGRMFAIGYDTAARVDNPKYYNPGELDKMYDTLDRAGTRFLVFGRVDAGGVYRNDITGFSPRFQKISRVVDEATFRCDISSTQKRAERDAREIPNHPARA